MPPSPDAPQSKPDNPSPKKRGLGFGGWLLIIVLAAATTFTLLWAVKVFTPWIPQKPVVSKTLVPRVSVYRIALPSSVRKVILSGRVVKPGPVLLQAPVAGKVLKLRAQPGKVYEKGTLMADLKSPVLEAKQLQLQDALAEAQDDLLAAAQNQSGNYSDAQRHYDAVAQQMAQVKADLAALHIQLPWRGRLLKYRVLPGDSVGAGAGVATVELLQNLDVVMTLPLTVLVDLNEKDKLDVLAKTRWGLLKTRGKITAIVLPEDPLATVGTLTIALSANRDVPLKQDQLVDVVFWLPTHGHAWVPQACVHNQDDKTVVGVIRPRGKTTRVEVRPVITGLVSNGTVEIIAGVTPGEQLVREGLSHFTPNQPVDPVNAITTPSPF